MFYLGVDLGQQRDHTALVAVERMERVGQLHVRHAERVALGVPYPKVVERIGALLRHQELRGQCALVVDATGVGAPVVDMLRGAGLGCEIAAVTITGGEREGQSNGRWNVPKRDLVGGVQVLLERGELRIAPELREAETLKRELLAVRATASRGGRVRLGADGEGEHDDLVIALALACWRARQRVVGFQPGILF
jgi:hypothetical protein